RAMPASTCDHSPNRDPDPASGQPTRPTGTQGVWGTRSPSAMTATPPAQLARYRRLSPTTTGPAPPARQPTGTDRNVGGLGDSVPQCNDHRNTGAARPDEQAGGP